MFLYNLDIHRSNIIENVLVTIAKAADGIKSNPEYKNAPNPIQSPIHFEQAKGFMFMFNCRAIGLAMYQLTTGTINNSK